MIKKSQGKVLRPQSGHIVLTRRLLDGYSWGFFLCNEQKKKEGKKLKLFIQLNHILFLLVLGNNLSNSLPSRALKIFTLAIEIPHEGHVTGGSLKKALKCYGAFG